MIAASEKLRVALNEVKSLRAEVAAIERRKTEESKAVEEDHAQHLASVGSIPGGVSTGVLIDIESNSIESDTDHSTQQNLLMDNTTDVLIPELVNQELPNSHKQQKDSTNHYLSQELF